jgi:glycosyltransferase involved in cell wall biosynthesis
MPIVLNYTGAENDRGGVVSVVRALASTERYECILGVAPNFSQSRRPPLKFVCFAKIAHERIDLGTMIRGLAVAREVRTWLLSDPCRIYHGRSRAGLIVALWLRLMGEKRAIASVHSLGRHKWFYRAAASILGPRLFWLNPSMKRYYRVGDSTWKGCLPDCVPESAWTSTRHRRSAIRPVHFGCVGSLVPVKQWELVLKAVALLPAGVAVRILHSGGQDGTPESAEYAAKLVKLADELGISRSVDWLGENQEMSSFYSKVDCLIVPSKWEASSVAALEAACAGVPLLASDESGTRDLIEMAECGWLFRSGSAKSLALEISSLASGTKYSDLRRKEDALLIFAAPAVADAHLKIYNALISD